MVVYDPRVVALAEQAVQVAEFMNQWWFRLFLVSMGILLIMWNWRFMARLRWFVGWKWRHALGVETWISRRAALDVIRQSDFAQSRKPSQTVRKQNNPMFSLSGLFSERVVMAPGKESTMLTRFSELILEKIASEYPDVVRDSGGEPTYLKEKIESWLDGAFDEEVLSEFGNVPNVTLK